MRCPTLDKLPDPPPGRSGWPWTVESPQLPDAMPDGSPWPRISIVTPSYNQGRFIEETIRSVLLQGYPDLEYFILDGDSADGSAAIIKKYERWLSYWRSSPDRGQSSALNEGFEMASGELYGWLNSDDRYRPKALAKLVALQHARPDAVAWVGASIEVEGDGEPIRVLAPRGLTKTELGDWWRKGFFHQPSCIFSAVPFHAAGGLDERIHFALDVDLWLRLVDLGPIASFDEVVSEARMHDAIKTRQDPTRREAEMIAVNINNGLPDVAKARLAWWADERIATTYAARLRGRKRVILSASQTLLSRIGAFLRRSLAFARRRSPSSNRLSKAERYDRQTVEVMRRHLHSESVCIDVGAHVGDLLREMERYAPRAVHYAIEPLPHLAARLRDDFPRARVLECALSDEPGEAEFHYVRNAPAYSGLRKRTYDTERVVIEMITVAVERLDDIVPEDICVDLIKIDVEGGEYDVIRGGLATIERSKPVIIFEAGEKSSSHYGVSPEMIYALITSELGFELSTMERWLSGRPSFSETEFIRSYAEEFYFIAYPAKQSRDAV